MAQANNKHRRAFLKGAPAVGFAALLVGATPAIAAEQPDTEIMAEFRIWSAINDRLIDPETPDQEHDKLCDDLWRVENRIKAMPATNPADFIAKVIAMTNYGQNGLEDDKSAPEFWAEAKAMMAA